MVGLAATSLIYAKWFRINNYYINQLVTTLIGSAVCPESKYFERVDEILGHVGEIFWTRRRRFGPLGGTRLVALARIPLRRHIFGHLGI